MTITIIHPSTAAHFYERDRLLQETLRPGHSSIPIAAEYPLVLSLEAAQFSFCVQVDGVIVAHANLFPRSLAMSDHAAFCSVGLVGNVATAERFRGKGIMHLLFAALRARAVQVGMEALFLWSDQPEFYHKLGFLEWGWEARYTFAAAPLSKIFPAGPKYVPVNAKDLSDGDLERLIALRNQAPCTLQRNVAEFRAQLNIPSTWLFMAPGGRADHGYCVVGRGCDMVGVAHEWGGAQPEAILAALSSIIELFQLPEITLLAPVEMNELWESCFRKNAAHREEFRMALIASGENIKVRDENTRTFIWGLDSI